jgi:hypothetical protein
MSWDGSDDHARGYAMLRPPGLWYCVLIWKPAHERCAPLRPRKS